MIHLHEIKGSYTERELAAIWWLTRGNFVRTGLREVTYDRAGTFRFRDKLDDGSYAGWTIITYEEVDYNHLLGWWKDAESPDFSDRLIS